MLVVGIDVAAEVHQVAVLDRATVSVPLCVSYGGLFARGLVSGPRRAHRPRVRPVCAELSEL
jgi:hypothetical protein